MFSAYRFCAVLTFFVFIAGCGAPQKEGNVSRQPAGYPSKGTATPPPPPPPAEPPPAVQVPTESPEGQGVFTRVGVFYATDRRRGPSTAPATIYGGNRNESAAEAPLEYGSCEVSIPAIHHTGELEAPKWWKLEFRPDPEKHVILLSVVPQAGDSFFANLKAAIDRASDRDAFVFIHGYNTTFQDAARRTAQIAYDLKFKGAPILYSWPSQGKAAAYTVDEAAVEWSTDHLRWFLTTIRQKTGATTIHLIAHSMGNRALTRALEAIPAEQKPMFRSIVLAAPDIDAGLFRQLADRFTSKAQRVTLYASSKDEALIASKKVHGYPRAGETDNGVLILPGIDTIDASAVKTDFLGHSYFNSIVPDMAVLFQFLAPPDKRPKLMPRTSGGGRYWMIQP